jgi:hypothetical protein
MRGWGRRWWRSEGERRSSKLKSSGVQELKSTARMGVLLAIPFPASVGGIIWRSIRVDREY